MTQQQTELVSLALKIEGVLGLPREANANDSVLRCRELSLAITNIEQGQHWVAARVAEIMGE